MSQQLGSAVFSKIAFRTKTYGWHEYCIDFFGEKEKVCSNKSNDPFFELFFDFLRVSFAARLFHDLSNKKVQNLFVFFSFKLLNYRAFFFQLL